MIIVPRVINGIAHMQRLSSFPFFFFFISFSFPFFPRFETLHSSFIHRATIPQTEAERSDRYVSYWPLFLRLLPLFIMWMAILHAVSRLRVTVDRRSIYIFDIWQMDLTFLFSFSYFTIIKNMEVLLGKLVSSRWKYNYTYLFILMAPL